AGKGAWLAHNDGLSMKIDRAHRLAPAPFMVAGDVGDERVGAEMDHMELRGPRPFRRHDGHVHFMVEQIAHHFLGAASREGYLDARMPADELGQHGQDVSRTVSPNLQTAALQSLCFIERKLDFVLKAEDLAAELEHPLSYLRRNDMLASPIQQPDAVLLLQCFDLPGKRRLTDAQDLRSPCETALARNGVEGPKVQKIHCN